MVQALDVLKKLRIEADIIYKEYKTRKGKISREKRTDTAVAESLQNFLLLGFMTIIPPDRSRTFHELKVGQTLKYGSFSSSVFTDVSRMTSKSEAKWYIHLLPEDYKTGATYKEWWGEVPNQGFNDGKNFYQYIDLWLSKYRLCLEPKHDFFFTKIEAKEPQDANRICLTIKSIFLRFTGKPVTPKELRKMYVTHLKDIGASEAELEAAAAWMHHSRQMQSQTYDNQHQQNKQAPIVALNKRILNGFFNPQS